MKNFPSALKGRITAFLVISIVTVCFTGVFHSSAFGSAGTSTFACYESPHHHQFHSLSQDTYLTSSPLTKPLLSIIFSYNQQKNQSAGKGSSLNIVTSCRQVLTFKPTFKIG